jgi:predicted anti-sigma-YlaC factor YlaD
MAHSNLTCKELVELVTDYLENALPPTERVRFEKHLQGCDGCRAYLEQMKSTINLTGQLTEEGIPESARQTLLETFRKWKQAHE